MFISNNLDDFLSAIQTDLSCALYYSNSKATYKIVYKYNKNDINLFEYKFMPDLNNTFRLLKSIPLGDKFAAIKIIKEWYRDNKTKVNILSKSEAFLFQKKISESKSCWKTPKQLGKAIKDGLEVPNCIPDSAYALNEVQTFLVKKNRELLGKYKKAVDWLNDVIADGDKDYAEKLLQIVEKWKRYYEDKIKLAKSVLKENEDVITSAEVIRDGKKRVKYYLKRSEESYNFFTKLIENQQSEIEQKRLQNKLEKWFADTTENLNNTLDLLNKTKDPTIKVHYIPFSLYDIDIMELNESPIVKQQIDRFITKSNEMKSDLQKFKEDSGFDSLDIKQKHELLQKFYEKHIKNETV